MSKILIALAMILTLTGCKNVKELENRDYVMAIGINKDKVYNITMAVANISDAENIAEDITEGKGNTLNEALANVNSKTKGSIYLGHNKAIILADNFNDYNEITEYASNNIELSRDSVIVKAKNPAEVIKSKNGKDSASKYIYTYFENKDKIDLDKLMDCYNNNSPVNLPKAEIVEGNLIIK